MKNRAACLWPFAGFIQFIAGFVTFLLTTGLGALLLYLDICSRAVVQIMAYDYTRKGRHYRKGDHRRQIWLLLILAAGVTAACMYIVVRH